MELPFASLRRLNGCGGRAMSENPGGSINTMTAPELHQENTLSPASAVTAPELSEENPCSSENGGAAPVLSAEVSSDLPIPVAVPEVQIELPNIDPEAAESVEVESMLADM